MNGRPDRRLFRDIIDFLAEPVFVKDDEHRVIHANQAFYDLFGLTPDQVIGSTLADSVPERERDHFLRVDRFVLDTGSPDLREEELTVGGRTRTIVTSKRRYVDDEGRRYLIGSIQDITDLLEIQRSLEAERARLEEALHEIHTLRGILPICSYCRKVRDDDSGSWRGMEEYVARHSEVSFSHGICEACAQEHFSGC